MNINPNNSHPYKRINLKRHKTKNKNKSIKEKSIFEIWKRFKNMHSVLAMCATITRMWMHFKTFNTFIQKYFTQKYFTQTQWKPCIMFDKDILLRCILNEVRNLWQCCTKLNYISTNDVILWRIQACNSSDD